jgi:hypothetical protein
MGTEVKKAYNALLKYLNLDSRKLKIAEKTDRKIVYRSYNFCPVLEACKILGLDTRKICKLVYEKPVKALFSEINLSLRFKRSYCRIRPYAEYCGEIMELEK